MEISQRRMTSVFKDCCRLLSCLLVFSGLVSAWARLRVIGGPAGGSDWHDSLSQSEDPRWHTPSPSSILPSSQRNGKDRCCNQCEVCGDKSQQLTEKLCHAAVHKPRCGMTQIGSYFSHTRVFVVSSVPLSHPVCGSRWRQTGYDW